MLPNSNLIAFMQLINASEVHSTVIAGLMKVKCALLLSLAVLNNKQASSKCHFEIFCMT